MTQHILSARFRVGGIQQTALAIQLFKKINDFKPDLGNKPVGEKVSVTDYNTNTSFSPIYLDYAE
jgi:hypothetical protein